MTMSSSRNRSPPTVTMRKPPSGSARTAWTRAVQPMSYRASAGATCSTSQPWRMATTPKQRRSLLPGMAVRSRTRRRYRGSKICRGRTTPGNRGVPSGNSGMSSPIPKAYGGRRATQHRWLPWKLLVQVSTPPTGHPEASVLARIDLRGSALPGSRELADLLPRAATDIDSVMATVRPLCEDVRIRGAQAGREITARLDGVDNEDFAVPQEALDRALAECEPSLRAALEEAITRVRRVHADQRRSDVTTQVVPGGTVTERWVPVRRVGLYVPGGLAPLLSSVVMNVVPAQIAGVESIAVASPPQRDHGGLPDPGVLAACALLGVTEVYAVGGAQAIAVFGYGAGSCEPVDMVTGP